MLVVDDEEQIAQIIEKFLSKSSFAVITASGGLEALAIINSNTKIDLMLLDIKMPKVDGLSVLKELKKTNKKIPIIILGGSVGNNHDLEELEELGFKEEDVFYKPLERYVLLDKVKQKLLISLH